MLLAGLVPLTQTGQGADIGVTAGRGRDGTYTSFWHRALHQQTRWRNLGGLRRRAHGLAHYDGTDIDTSIVLDDTSSLHWSAWEESEKTAS